MSNVVFELFAKLGLDSSEYEEGLKDAESQATSIGGKIAGGLKTVGAAGAVIGTAVAGATAAATTALVKGAGELAAYGDTIDKESQKLGISAEAYQEWDAIMQHTGGSVSNLKPALKTLSKEIMNNSDAFQQLGISQEEMKNASIEEVLNMTITKLQGMDAGVERTRLATQLLGKSSVELGALLNTSAEDTEAMRQRVHELGGVMSDEAVKAAAAYQDSLQDMKTGFDSLKRGMLSEFLPSITTVMDGLTNIFAGDYDKGLEQISEGIDAAVANIADVLPKALDVGINIIEALASAIVENAPKIFPSIVSLLISISTMIIENLPLLLQSGVQLLLAVGKGIVEALPDILPTIIDVVIQIAEALIDNIDLLVDAAIQLTLGLANGLIEALPVLIEKAPEIITKLVEALVNNAPLLLQAGLTLIVTLVSAIITNLPQLLESGKKIVTTLIEGIKSLFTSIVQIALELINKFVNGINEAKSKLLAIGKKIIEAVKEGIKQKIDDAKNWGKDLIANFIAGIMEKWNSLKETVANVAGTIKDFLGFSEPKEGPLSNFHTFAPDMMKLFAQGIEDNEHLISDQIAKSFDIGDMIANVAPSINTTTTNQNDIIRLLEEIAAKKEVHITLEGGLDRLFRAMQTESLRHRQITGQESFA